MNSTVELEPTPFLAREDKGVPVDRGFTRQVNMTKALSGIEGFHLDEDEIERSMFEAPGFVVNGAGTVLGAITEADKSRTNIPTSKTPAPALDARCACQGILKYINTNTLRCDKCGMLYKDNQR